MHTEYMYTSNFAVFEPVFLLFSFNLTQTLPRKCNMQLHAQLSVPTFCRNGMTNGFTHILPSTPKSFQLI
jgi:hypothetical protein